MRKRIGLILIFATLVPAVGAQHQVRDNTRSDARDNAQRNAEEKQRKAEEALRKTQAVDILKGVIDSANDIQETQTRVAILTNALDLLWKHDEAYARANLIKYVGALSDRFAADETRGKERSEIRAAIRLLLAAFARHDPQAATRLLDKFQTLLE